MSGDGWRVPEPVLSFLKRPVVNIQLVINGDFVLCWNMYTGILLYILFQIFSRKSCCSTNLFVSLQSNIYNTQHMSKYEIPFLTACIQAFGRRFSMTRQAAFRYLHEHKGLAFLIEFYDVEHLQSMDETIDDLLIVCQKNGGALAWFFITVPTKT